MDHLCLLLCLLTGVQSVSITDFAVPSYLEAGQNAELQCRYSLAGHEPESLVVVKWWHTGQDAERHLIYQRLGSARPQTVGPHIESVANDSLLLSELSPARSGLYECQVSVIDEVKQARYLTVYTGGSGPHVNVTLVDDDDEDDEDDEDTLVITCEATDVAPEPELVITVNDAVLNATSEVVRSAGAAAGAEAGEGAGRLYDVRASGRVPAGDARVRCELFYTDEDVAHPAYTDQITYDHTGLALDAAEDAARGVTEPVAATQDAAPADGAGVAHSSAALVLLFVLLTCFM